MPDRIEAATFAALAAITESEIQITNIVPDHLTSVFGVFDKIGVNIETDSDKKTALIIGKTHYLPTNVLTGPYPSFPTDIQPLITTLLSLSSGVSTVTDSIFPNRFCYVHELQKMGTEIIIADGSAKVKGVQSLSGADVFATDLRGGAALILAGLVAQGTTVISNCGTIHRGYENITQNLRHIGAKVTDY